MGYFFGRKNEQKIWEDNFLNKLRWFENLFQKTIFFIIVSY